MKLDPLVAQIIATTNFNHFTTSDVRSTYLVLKNDSSLESTSVRRKIYAELLKLVKKGWLEKLIPKNKKGPTRFSKTVLFDVEQIQLKNEDEPIEVINDIYKKKEQLLSKLNIYKAELLLNMGESEAYKELYSEFPELIDEIQPKYNKARDNNTRILGKIRAIEGLMDQDSP
ncbi:hypothetical protein ACPUVO_13230 [Pseudocolwellia sp. HL-MZ19]|uniref:hypothetical protein n=1 Tax=Pseudocolwellia sp. HL-MZ19 TaxID=3400846 RepID=UPI003CF76C61